MECFYRSSTGHSPPRGGEGPRVPGRWFITVLGRGLMTASTRTIALVAQEPDCVLDQAEDLNAANFKLTDDSNSKFL